MAADTSAVHYDEGTFKGTRGLNLCTSHWQRKSGPDPKGIVFLCHGYTLNCSKYLQSTARALANAGYSVYGLDNEGHGKSEGIKAIVWSLEAITADYKAYVKSIGERAEDMGKPRFLIGESLGAGVAQLLLAEEPEAWHGALLMGPLFIMSKNISPPSLVLAGFKMMAAMFPTAALGPDFKLDETGIEDPEKKESFRKDELIYQGNSRLQSLVSLFYGADVLQAKANKITAPLLVLHGEKDVICDAKDSEVLVETVSSKDKALKVYPGMWHLLTEGGTPEHCQIVLKDMVEWLDARTS